jgi:DNA mismatch repair ATPase MutS
LAEVAATSGYCRPELVEGRELRIEAGRHPVVEQLLVEEPFTANDLALGGDAGHPPSPLTGLVLGDSAAPPCTGRHAERERRHGGAELAANGNRPDTVNLTPASDWPGSPTGTASRGQADPDQADNGNALSDSPDARFGGPDTQLEGTLNAPAGSPEARFSDGERADAPDLLVLTGPNASGKSCYLRQSGLLQLMAQIGSWIPARSARLGIADRIFTRVGAVDDLASGQSTFMVEMAETANILHHASARSLVLLDEIGRGTATFDGLSIAWAVAEHLATAIGARTIFATHYHELNELAALLPNVGNAQVLVQETGDDLVFLHRVSRGGASRSYGIEAARLAGVPATVVLRARQVLGRIEANSHVAVGLEAEPMAVERA